MKPTSDVITQRVGLQIRKLRREEGMSQEELGQPIGLTRYQVSRMERGRRRIAVDDLVLIAVTLDRMSADFFVDVFQGF
jgi:transcriptional regulator with XRE-family HTH domain